MRALWTTPRLDYTGEFHRIDRAGIAPLPVQRPIPIWFGGATASAVLDRIARIGDGWMCNLPLDDSVRQAVDTIRRLASEYGREQDSIGLEGRVTVGRDVDARDIRTQIERWRALGATHLAFNGCAPAARRRTT